MEAAAEIVRVSGTYSITITKVKVRRRQKVSKGTIFCIYSTKGKVNQKWKSDTVGIITDVYIQEGQELQPGDNLVSVEGCSHPTVMKDMCADCGADLRIENSTAGDRKGEVSASVAMVHNIPELIVSEKLAHELGKADEEQLLKTRKLVLLVDLDQTLIHTTNDNIPPNLKDVHHYQMWHGKQLLWYHTRLRPHTKTFLESVSRLYELHICTFGTRLYAHTIAKILDPKGKYFSTRILSRDECFNATSKIANLKALFPCGDGMVCIIDDREDVWNNSPNLVHVKPYRFFQGTADINAPPGLAKTEHDEEPIVHRERRVSQSSTDSSSSTQGKDGRNQSRANSVDRKQTAADIKSKTEVLAETQSVNDKVDGSESEMVEDAENVTDTNKTSTGCEDKMEVDGHGNKSEESAKICVKDHVKELDEKHNAQHISNSAADIADNENNMSNETKALSDENMEIDKGASEDDNVDVGSKQTKTGQHIVGDSGNTTNDKMDKVDTKVEGENINGESNGIPSKGMEVGSGDQKAKGENDDDIKSKTEVLAERQSVNDKVDGSDSEMVEDAENVTDTNKTSTGCEDKLEVDGLGNKSEESAKICVKDHVKELDEKHNAQDISNSAADIADNENNLSNETKALSDENMEIDKGASEDDNVDVGSKQTKTGQHIVGDSGNTTNDNMDKVDTKVEGENINGESNGIPTKGMEVGSGDQKAKGENDDDIKSKTEVLAERQSVKDKVDGSDSEMVEDAENVTDTNKTSTGCEDKLEVDGLGNKSEESAKICVKDHVKELDEKHNAQDISNSAADIADNENNLSNETKALSDENMEIDKGASEDDNVDVGSKQTKTGQHIVGDSGNTTNVNMDKVDTKVEGENINGESNGIPSKGMEVGSRDQKAKGENDDGSEGDKVGELKNDEANEEWLEWDDEDDYLYYLEESLVKIHTAFYDIHDQLKEKESNGEEAEKPNLKNIIPYIRRKVLKGCNIVFSGVIPTNMQTEKHRAHIVATALGATVQDSFIPKKTETDNPTTHVIAARAGTSKVRSASKHKSCNIVSVDWLWSCSERWEQVEESLFPLTEESKSVSPDVSQLSKKDSGCKRKSDDTDISNEKPGQDIKRQKRDNIKSETMDDSRGNVDSSGNNEPCSSVPVIESKFALSYNPLYSFSDEDIEVMDKEIEDMLDEDNDSSEDDTSRDSRIRGRVLKSVDHDSSSNESLSGDMPRGWGLSKKLSPKSSSSEDESKVGSPQHEQQLPQEYESETEMDRFEKTLEAFAPDSDSDSYQESIGSVDDELAEAVEKEFLA